MSDHQKHHETQLLREIAVDYTPEACSHCPETNKIELTYDHRGGARWRSKTRFLHGVFRSRIRCPAGDTSGLNFNLYLSSLEGDSTQDEIDFEFLGRDRSVVQTNFFAGGSGGREIVHDLGFDCSEESHEYAVSWGRDLIEWFVDGKVLRREERKEGVGFVDRPMYLYASIWDASEIDGGRWTGNYTGSHAPYVCLYEDVHVPLHTAVHDD